MKNNCVVNQKFLLLFKRTTKNYWQNCEACKFKCVLKCIKSKSIVKFLNSLGNENISRKLATSC